jgi:hypothetical protein
MLGLLLLLLVPVAALALCGVVLAVLVKAFSLALPGRPPFDGARLARWGAWLLAVVAASVYVLGAGLVLLDVNESSHGADSSPAPACRDADPATTEGLWSSRPSYLPLSFTCVRRDGSTYEGEPVLGWCNGLALGGAVGALLLSGAASRRRPPQDRALPEDRALSLPGEAARREPPPASDPGGSARAREREAARGEGRPEETP